MRMSKTNKILTGLVIILAIALGAVVYWQTVDSEEKYSAVYLDTGDIYFGKLSRFPRMTLRDVWFLQKGGEGQGFALSKFEHAFWAPDDRLVIVSEHVIWVADLKTDSEVVRAIKNPRAGEPVQMEAQSMQQMIQGSEESVEAEKNVQ